MLMTTKLETELKPYKAGDFQLLRGRMRDTDKRTFQPGTDALLDAIAENKLPGSAVTLWAGDMPVIVGAVMPAWPGVGNAMAWTTEDLPQYGKEATLAANAFLNVAEDEFGFHRMQCTVLADFDKGIRWMERMGFQIEGTLRGYTRMGEDCVMMARVK